MKTKFAGYYFVTLLSAFALENNADSSCAKKAVRASEHVDVPLPNACVPKDVAFLQTYIADNPTESGGLFAIELPGDDGVPEGHALAVFTHKRMTWFFDHQIGIVSTGIPSETFDASTAKTVISELYASHLHTWKTESRKPMIPCSPTARKEAILAGRILGGGLAPTIVKICGREEYICMWDFNGYLWAYSPSRGTTWVKQDGKKNYVTLVAEALARFNIWRPFEMFKMTSGRK